MIPLNQNMFLDIAISDAGISINKKNHFQRKKILIPWQDVVDVKYSIRRVYGIKVINFDPMFTYYGKTYFADSSPYILVGLRLPNHEQLINIVKAHQQVEPAVADRAHCP